MLQSSKAGGQDGPTAQKQLSGKQGTAPTLHMSRASPLADQSLGADGGWSLGGVAAAVDRSEQTSPSYGI